MIDVTGLDWAVNQLDPADRLAPENAGLAAWYLALPEGMGGPTWRDLIGTNTGTLTNMAVPGTATSGWGPTTRPGGSGELRFDGTDDYVDVGSVSLGDTPWLGAWAFPTSAASGVFRTICTKRDGNTNATEYGFDLAGGSNTLRFYLNNGGFRIWETSASISLNAWSRVDVTYDSANGPIFDFGGSPVSSTQTAGSGQPAPLANAVATRIGAFVNFVGTSDPSWSGMLDDVVLGMRRPTAAEIARRYDLSRRGYPPC